MSLTENLYRFMSERGINRSELAKGSGVPYTTIVALFEKGADNIKLSTMRKLAEYFGVTLDDLVDDSSVDITEAPYYALTAKDERDIAIMLENMMEGLQDGQSMNFMGEPMDEDDRELLRISLENTIRMSKQMAKKKFTPKKYRDGE